MAFQEAFPEDLGPLRNPGESWAQGFLVYRGDEIKLCCPHRDIIKGSNPR